MKKTLICVYLAIGCSSVWSQSSRTLPPPPPPPNPGAISNLGSPSFYIFQNNMSVAQHPAPSGNAPITQKAGDIKNSMSSFVPGVESRSWQFPKSFESSIQGLQFIHSESLQ